MKEFTDKERVDWLEKQLVEVWCCVPGSFAAESFETSENDPPGALRSLIDNQLAFDLNTNKEQLND